MSPDTNHLFARITPVDSEHANRVLNTWSLICNLLVTQSLGILYGFSCSVLPFLIGLVIASMNGATVGSALGLGVALALIGGAAGFVGLRFHGFPVLIFERRLCTKLLKTVDLRANPVVSPLDPMTRVVELVPRQRWRKSFCLDTATDLMIIRVDERGVWMKGDRYRYELPAESILAAECERFRPPSCSYRHYMAVIHVRTEDGTIELPISYRDYLWRDTLGTRRETQTMDLVAQINAVAKGHFLGPPQPPTVAIDHEPMWPRSTNPYESPALTNE